MSGYVPLHRKIMDNPLWTQMPAERLKIWLTILLRMNYKPSTVWVQAKQQHVTIEAGQMLTSRTDLAHKSRTTVKQVRLALEYFCAAQMITLATSEFGTIITVLNWSTYRAQGPTEGQQGANLGPAKGQQGAISEEVKEGKKKTFTGEGLDSFAAAAPLDLFPSDDLEDDLEAAVTPKTVSPKVVMVSELAARMIDRHPKYYPVTAEQVTKKLMSVLKPHSRRIWPELLQAIEANHLEACRHPQWQKDGGQFATKLTNWIEPGVLAAKARPAVIEPPKRILGVNFGGLLG